MLKVLLAGGGTGGHINPALAIASIIKQHHPDAEFLFAGTPNGMEATLIPKAGYNFAPIKVSGFQRKLNPENIVRNVKAASYLAMSGSRAKKIISDFKPDVVIGTGGYVSYPILAKAVQMGTAIFTDPYYIYNFFVDTTLFVFSHQKIIVISTCFLFNFSIDLTSKT